MRVCVEKGESGWESPPGTEHRALDRPTYPCFESWSSHRLVGDASDMQIGVYREDDKWRLMTHVLAISASMGIAFRIYADPAFICNCKMLDSRLISFSWSKDEESGRPTVNNNLIYRGEAKDMVLRHHPNKIFHGRKDPR
ncbi:unnamed protein product [Victoria cruziana]